MARRSYLPRLAAGALVTFSLLSACAPPDDESIEVLPTSVLDTSGTTALGPGAFNEGGINVPTAGGDSNMVSPFGDATIPTTGTIPNPGLVNRVPTASTSRLTGGATTGGSTTGMVMPRVTTSSSDDTTGDATTGGSTSGSTTGGVSISTLTGGSTTGGSTSGGSTSGSTTRGLTTGSGGTTSGLTSGSSSTGGTTSGSTTGGSNSRYLYPAGETKGIVFGQYDTGQLKLDLMLPDSGSNFPVVVYIHGGGWYAGGNGIPDAGHLRRLVDDGFAVASIEYRLSTQEIFPAQLYDAELAVSWLRTYSELIGIDGDNIAVMGDSAGGHIAALLGTTASASDPWRVQAVIARAAPSDLTATSGTPSGLLEMETQLLGCAPSQCPDRAQWASPNQHASRTAPPFLIEHGLNDSVVPFEHAQILQQALQSVGADSTLITYNGDHNAPEYNSDADYNRVLDFLRRTLT